jgi:hypothetical protein
MKLKKISIIISTVAASFMFQLQISELGFQIPEAHAANYQMLFWYPGEAGTTEEAQGTLDALFDHINPKIAPDKLSGKYFNTVEGGAGFIRQARPKYGIVSFAAYRINSASLGQNTILMQTLPLPDGRPAERYVIVGRGPAPRDWANVQLYSKQPLTNEFVKEFILPPLPQGERVKNVQNILPALKEIASGARQGGVILQPIEHFTLKSLKQPWVKGLSVWHISNELPSAPLLLFGTEDGFTQKFKAALLNMASGPEGKAILETLRLKGFTAKSE